ncbi:MAG: branched-chain amino acid ABC transporter permease [Rhizobiales bacterium PAR1]|nr:MAG: branched-chain amino acid ABC transporter permease [Rhizobiales bacterium PAR1]
MLNATVISQILWTSLATSSYFVLFALAFALVLKVNKVFNFAQAGMMTCGFYAAYVAVRVVGLPGPAGFIAALAGGAAMAFVLERFGFSVLRHRKASPMFVFIFTLVASQFITYAMTMIFGTWPTTIFASMFWPVTLVADVAVSAWDIPAILATVAVLSGLWAFLRFTRYGQFMIAVADNADLAELYGIRKDRVLMVSMLIAGLICGVGMFLYGTRAQVQPAAATELMLFAVAATILGGIGNLWGAALAAVVLGVVQNSSILFIPSAWQGFLLYAFLFFAIVLFPSGFRLPERSKALKRTVAAPVIAADGKGG